MPRHLRYQPTAWATHLVTTRCTQGYALLRPSPQLNALILGCLARSLELHRGEVELHHYVFMSNHYHLLISTLNARAKSRFMCHLNSNLARELCRAWRWRDHVWEKRYASDVVLDESALVATLKYIFKNSVKERLVEHPREWPGAHGWAPLCGGDAAYGEWVDRSALFFARQTQKGRHKTERDFTRRLEVRLCPPRCWGEMSDEDYRARCGRLAEEATAEALSGLAAEAEAQASARPISRRVSVDVGLSEGAGAAVRVRFLGAEGVCAQPVFEARPSKGLPRPLCRSRCPQLRAEFVSAYGEFKLLFQRASARLRAGVLREGRAPQVRFPPGGVGVFI